MNVQLRHQREFLAAFWIPDDIFNTSLVMNHYKIDLRMITATSDQREINVAVARCLYMIDQEFTDTVFVEQCHGDLIEHLEAAGADVTELPAQPVDQIIGIMLYCKLNAVMEQRVRISRLELSSVRGQDVWYAHDENETQGPFDTAGWWDRGDLDRHHRDQDRENIAVIQPDPWKQLDLSWPEPTETSSKILYADFRRDDTRSVRPDDL